MMITPLHKLRVFNLLLLLLLLLFFLYRKAFIKECANGMQYLMSILLDWYVGYIYDDG